MADTIEGKRAVIEALKSGVPVREVFLADNLERDGMVKDIIRKAKQRDIPIKDVPRRRLEEMASAHKGQHGIDRDKDITQGVLAKADPFRYSSLTDILQHAEDEVQDHGHALVVVCDHLTDAGNLGAVARSAESVGASGMVIPNKRAARVTPTTYKTSAGAIAHMKVTQVANIPSALERLKEHGFWVAGATEHADDLIWDTNLKGKIALVMGNEQTGISRLVLENCDLTCRLPQQGSISSLNVAQASTVFMYEWLRQNRG